MLLIREDMQLLSFEEEYQRCCNVVVVDHVILEKIMSSQKRARVSSQSEAIALLRDRKKIRFGQPTDNNKQVETIRG